MHPEVEIGADSLAPSTDRDTPSRDSGVGDSAWALFQPHFTLQAAATRWVGGIYLLLLGLALLVLAPAPISSPVDSALRGVATALSGLALLWLAVLAPSWRVTFAVSAMVALPQLWFASEFWRQGIVPGAATLGLLALAILLTGAQQIPDHGASPSADALGLAFGAAQAIQGVSFLLQPRLANPIPDAVGLSTATCAMLLIAAGVMVVVAQLLPQLPLNVFRAAHLFSGAVTLIMWAAVGLRFDTAYLYLGAATLVRGVSIAALPWLGGWLEDFDGRALAPRLALAFGSLSLVPLLVAVTLVLDATVGRAGQAAVRQAVFGGILLLLIVAAVVAGWLAARLTAPLAALVRAVEGVAAGERPMALPSTTTELDRLGMAVLTMADTIAAREAALEGRRREFETLVGHSPDIVARFDRDLRHRYVNAAIEALTGLRPDAILGKTNTELGMPSEVVTLFEHHAHAALATGEERYYEFTFPSPDGLRHFRTRLVPEVAADGVAETLLAITYDVTERKVAEQTLRESEARFRTMADSTPVVIWVTDTAGGIRFVNRAYVAFFGVTEEEVRGLAWQPLVHPADAPAFIDALFAALRDHAPFRAEARMRRAGGEWRWIESFGAPRFGAHGELLGMVGSSLDVTERKEAEGERVAFLDALAHDVKNPLSAIKGQAQLARRRLQRGTDDPERLDASLGGIETGVDGAVALIDELLDVARLRAGRSLDLRLLPVDLVALAEARAEEAVRGSDKHSIQLAAELTPIIGNWDEARLARVLDNLIGNAVKYTPNGGEIVVRIGLEEDVQGTWAVLSVRDPGIGIPVPDLSRIFERFQRGSNVAAFGGTGIGLAGTRQIVEQHGGTITVASEEGVGSTFTVRLPLTSTEPGESR